MGSEPTAAHTSALFSVANHVRGQDGVRGDVTERLDEDRPRDEVAQKIINRKRVLPCVSLPSDTAAYQSGQ